MSIAIGEVLLKRGLKKEMKNADFIVTSLRPPAVYSGNPFQVEAGIVYDSTLPVENEIEIMRFANRVPLLYQQGGCAITHVIESMDWRRYGLEQRGGSGIPIGPANIGVHVASTRVPFTSESKEAIADIPEIQNEIEYALRECSRKMLSHIRKKLKLAKLKEKEEIIRKILPMIAKKCADVLNRDILPIDSVVAKIMNSIIIKDEITYDEKNKIHKVKLEISNYTPTGKNFILKANIPKEANIQNIQPECEITNNILSWEIKRLPSMNNIEIKFDLSSLEKGDYEEAELYVDDIDEEIVSGADAWREEIAEKKIKGEEETEGE